MNAVAISALQRWISHFSDDTSRYAASLPQSPSLLDRDTTGSPKPATGRRPITSAAETLEARAVRLFLPAGGEAKVSVGSTTARFAVI